MSKESPLLDAHNVFYAFIYTICVAGAYFFVVIPYLAKDPWGAAHFPSSEDFKVNLTLLVSALAFFSWIFPKKGLGMCATLTGAFLILRWLFNHSDSYWIMFCPILLPSVMAIILTAINSMVQSRSSGEASHAGH